LRAATVIRAQLANEGLRVRIGLHVGDVERRGDDIGGVSVHIAARVMALAGPGEILTTAAIPMAVTGTDHRFDPIGDRDLKGVPGLWAVFQLVVTTEPTTAPG
jgi:class 3 adenylate cyclase